MNHRVPSTLHQMTARMALADGSKWSIVAGDERASVIVARLVAAMQLSPMVSQSGHLLTGEAESPILNFTHRLFVKVDRKRATFNMLQSKERDTVTCIFKPWASGDELASQLVWLSLVIVGYTESRGAVLVHGALAERDGWGVILAGPGGRGKTTASQRLALPWRSLSDDATLVVCDKNGTYWAHPWPTWSNFMFGGGGGSWNVQHAVPLRGIFFLEQAKKEQFEPLGTAKATCLLTESTEQVSRLILRNMDRKQIREVRLQRFDNVCAIVQAVPYYVLRLDRHGTFWKEIERLLHG